MGVAFPAATGLTRNGSFLNPAQDWTICFWVRCVAVPVDDEYQSIHLLGPPDYTPPYIQLEVLAEGLIAAANIGAGDVVTDATPPLVADVDYFVAYQYDADDQEIAVILNGEEFDVVSVDLSAVAPIAAERLGTDEAGSVAGLQLSHVRAWQEKLSIAQLRVEQGTNTWVHTPNLLVDTPLAAASQLQDITGHDHGWTAIGTPTSAVSPITEHITLGAGVKFLSSDTIYARSQTLDGTITGATLLEAFVPVGFSGIAARAGGTEYYALTSSGGVSRITVFNAGGEVLRHITDTEGRNYVWLIVLPSGNLLVSVLNQVPETESFLLEYTTTGGLVAVHGGLIGGYASTMAVNGTTLLYTPFENAVPFAATAVFRYDLATDTLGDPLIPPPEDPPPYPDYFGLVALPDGGAIVGQPDKDADPKLQRVDADGAVLWTQNFDADAAVWGIGVDLVAGIVWVFEHRRDADFVTTPARLFGVSGATGALLTTVTLSQAFSALAFVFIAAPTSGPSYQIVERAKRRVRRTPHLSNEQKRIFYPGLQVDLVPGIGNVVAPGVEPQVMLRMSRDGGNTWGPERWMSAGRLGEYSKRVIARQLGSGRDVVFEVIVSDPNNWNLIAAYFAPPLIPGKF